MTNIGNPLEHDLRQHLDAVTKAHAGIEEIYLFGSRAYQTESLRSDCDLLVRVADGKNVKSSELRDYAVRVCAALDFFICDGGKAISCSNGSFVYASSFEELHKRLDAVPLWSRSGGFSDFAFADTGSMVFKTAANVNFMMTTLPDELVAEQAWQQKIRKVEADGLPAHPFIGDSLPRAVTAIIEVSRRMIFQAKDLGQKGVAKDGWTVDLQSEYDCQNLFFNAVKPWLPSLGREEVAINYDGHDKKSDFSLFRSRLIIEMKFIDTAVKEAAVVKTLQGLRDFYTRHANIGCLLMIIYVKEGTVSIDAAKWEADFSYRMTSPVVTTIVIPVP